MSGLLHGLNSERFPVLVFNENRRLVRTDKKLLDIGEGSLFSIDDGKTIDYGRVRFSCSGAGCEVQIINTGKRGFNVTYKGNVSATLLPFDTAKMWNGIWGDHRYCLNDSLGDCTLAIPSVYSRSIRSKEILLDIGLQYILTEDRKTQIASNYGWKGKRYAHNSDGSPADDEAKYRTEMIIYSNADGSEDTDYLSYGRSMVIYGNGNWAVTGVSEKSSGSTYGLGQQTGKVTYIGGATGWYVFDGTEAGHFTARATLQADLGNDLEISGTIDQFVDENSRSRKWIVDLESNKFNNRSDARINTSKKTIWTIDGTRADPGQRWEGRAADNGNSIHGKFRATHNGTKGRLDGAFGADRR